MKPNMQILTIPVLIMCVMLCCVGCDKKDTNTKPPTIEPTETATETPTSETPVAPPALTHNFPDDIPIYTGAVVARFQEQETGAMSAILTTPDLLDPVSAFYRDGCAANGWKENRTTSGIKAGATYILSYTKNGRYLSITITRKENTPLTSISMMMSGS